MARTHRRSTAVALMACLVAGPLCGGLSATEVERSSNGAPASSPPASIASPATLASVDQPGPFTFTDARLPAEVQAEGARAQAWRSSFNVVPAESSSFAQYRGYRGRGRRDRHDSAAAIILGATASIAGTAVLLYANRPECSTSQMASGCSYGTKVVGGAVLSAGIVSLVFGALTWR
jgi:hypothetical protein